MSIEELLGGSLERTLSGLDTEPGDLAEVRTRGARLRRTRRVAVAGLAVVLLSAGGLAAGLTRELAGDHAADPAVGHGGSWQRLPDPPLSPRSQPIVVWDGREVLVLGGQSVPCPADALCNQVDTGASGASYDVVTRSWRRIADAPVEVDDAYRTAVVGRTVVLHASEGGRWLAYDAAADRWSFLPRPPQRTYDSGYLGAYDGRVYAMSDTRRVQVLDLATRAWSVLPAPPVRVLGPVVATSAGVFVSGADPGPPRIDGGFLGPQPVVVERWDGTAWTDLGATGQTGSFTTWTGTRLLDADPQVDPGLPGRPPHGGRFDPATSRWSPLPDPPDLEQGGGWAAVAQDGSLWAGFGRVYDDDAGTWTLLPRPDGADAEQGMGATWAAGHLFAIGGVLSTIGDQTVTAVSGQAWEWTP